MDHIDTVIVAMKLRPSAIAHFCQVSVNVNVVLYSQNVVVLAK